MEKFFEKIKDAIKYEDDIKNLLPYYAALKQMTEMKPFREMVEDVKNKSFDITYHEADENDWYSDGEFLVHVDDDFRNVYRIKLERDDRDWGYCDCKPSMKMYNHVHKCCGNGCDYTFPKIDIVKIIYKCSHGYDGVANQLWKDLEEIEVEFSGDRNKSRELHIERQKQAIQDQIELLHKQLEELNK